MIINVDNSSDYIRAYINLIAGVKGIPARHVDVAVIMITYFIRLQREAKKVDHPMTDKEATLKVASMDFVGAMTRDIGMSVGVFRNYVTQLKRKGFIKDQCINRDWIPSGRSSSITIRYEL